MSKKIRPMRLAEEVYKSDIPTSVFATDCGLTPEQFEYYLRGYRNPPIKCFISVSKLLNTNISYLLGHTDISHKNDTYDMALRLRELREENGYTFHKAANHLEISPSTVKRNEYTASLPGMGAAIIYAECYGVSVDYLLGLTEYRTWEPFLHVMPGEATYISNMDKFALLSDDGQSLIFSNGELMSKDSKCFLDSKIVPLKKYVKE